MPLVSFPELMSAAEHGGYAVGYFEAWNLESLQGVLDAAEAMRSPVILGFGGLRLPDPGRLLPERLELYAAMGLAACRAATVPAALLFNESPYLDWIERALDLGFNLVMYSHEHMTLDQLRPNVQQTVHLARRHGAAVEAELQALPGMGAGLAAAPDVEASLTDPESAARFVRETGVDALAVAIGNVHLHGRQRTSLNIERLDAIRAVVDVPLVLHGATSVSDEAIRAGIAHGLRKINVGSVLLRTYLEAVREAANTAGPDYNPYEVVGSGLAGDIDLAGRLAIKQVVAAKMTLFGSAGQAG